MSNPTTMYSQHCKHSRVSTIATAAAMAAGIAGPLNDLYAETEKTVKNPNIIYIFADQMRAQVLGCYGNEIVPTPNFDAMAANGMVFDNARCVHPTGPCC